MPEGEYVLIQYTGAQADPEPGNWTIEDTGATGWNWGEVIHDTDANRIILLFSMPRGTVMLIK